jgi:hypothetical protein
MNGASQLWLNGPDSYRDTKLITKRKTKPYRVNGKGKSKRHNRSFRLQRREHQIPRLKEHIRLRPGMYIGKLGDGSSPDDGIYVLAKEVIDNCIDEYTMGYGKTVEITLKESR